MGQVAYWIHKSRCAALPVFRASTGKRSIRLRLLDFSLYGLAQGEAPRPQGPGGCLAQTAQRRGGDGVTFQKGTDNKTAQVRIRFTPDEKAQAEAFAKEGGLTLSEYIRKRALGLPVRSKADAQMINELRRLGGLVKHIHNQTDGVNSKETAGVLVSITEAIKRIGE